MTRMILVPIVREGRRMLMIRMHNNIVEFEVWMRIYILSMCRSLKLPGAKSHETGALLGLRSIEALDSFMVITPRVLEGLL